MATLPELPEWVEGIYQLEDTDPVIGGVDGVDNRPAKELANRTLYLKAAVESVGGAFRDLLIGVPLPYPAAVPPTGCLIMKGQSLDPDSYPILHNLYGGVLTDMRGEFVRGWDGGRGVDAERALLSWQKASLAVAGNNNEGVWFQLFYQNKISPSLESFGFDVFDAADYQAVFRADIAPARTGYSAASLAPAGVGASRPRNMSFNYICLAG